MELLRRYVWVVDLTGILIGAGIAGHATANFIGRALPAQAAPAPPSRRAPRPALPADWVDESIKPITPPDTWQAVRKTTGVRRYEISRRFVDELLQGGTSPPFPRIVPATREGETVGVYLYGVDPRGPFAAIGLTRGDQLREVNGIPLTSPDSALRAYTSLRNAKHAWIVIERSGRFVRLDYDIR